MLETLCLSSMHDSVFWFVSAGYVLCCTSEGVVTSEGKIINNSPGAVPSLDTVLLLVFIARAKRIFLQVLPSLSLLLT